MIGKGPAAMIHVGRQTMEYRAPSVRQHKQVQFVLPPIAMAMDQLKNE